MSPSVLYCIAAAVWLVLGFAICGGDLRLGCTLGLLLGGIAWELTAGMLLRPVFAGFCQGIAALARMSLLPVKKFLYFDNNSLNSVLIFVKPTEGEIMCEFAKDNLIYSETTARIFLRTSSSVTLLKAVGRLALVSFSFIVFFSTGFKPLTFALISA